MCFPTSAAPLTGIFMSTHSGISLARQVPTGKNKQTKQQTRKSAATEPMRLENSPSSPRPNLLETGYLPHLQVSPPEPWGVESNGGKIAEELKRTREPYGL